MCRAVRGVFDQRGLRLHRDSALSVLLRYAEDRAPFPEEGVGAQDMLRLGHVHRVAAAILAVGLDEAALESLRRMSSGPLDLGSAGISAGRDALWELQLVSSLRRHGLHALLEEPDVVVYAVNGRYPIACKNVYSDSNVQSQMKKGAQQLARFGQPGLVAFNYEPLLMENAIFRASNSRTAGDALAALNRRFLDRHTRHIARYANRGHCHGAMATVCVVADLPEESPRFVTYSQTTIMTGAPPYALSPVLGMIAEKLNHSPLG